MHRFVLGYFGELHIDHINHDELDNRKQNLRVCTASVNGLNRRGLPSDNTSGYMGVAPSKWGWHAYTTIEGKRYHLGYYDTLGKAAYVRRSWKLGDPLPRKPYRKDNTTGCKGVVEHYSNGVRYWLARIQIGGIVYGLGCHRKLKDAVFARKFAEEKLSQGWLIRATSCQCGGHWGWYRPENGCEISEGCICHATRKCGLSWAEQEVF